MQPWVGVRAPRSGTSAVMPLQSAALIITTQMSDTITKMEHYGLHKGGVDCRVFAVHCFILHRCMMAASCWQWTCSGGVLLSPSVLCLKSAAIVQTSEWVSVTWSDHLVHMCCWLTPLGFFAFSAWLQSGTFWWFSKVGTVGENVSRYTNKSVLVSDMCIEAKVGVLLWADTVTFIFSVSLQKSSAALCCVMF